MRVHVCVSVFACVFAFVRACVHICVCMYACMHLCIYFSFYTLVSHNTRKQDTHAHTNTVLHLAHNVAKRACRNAWLTRMLDGKLYGMWKGRELNDVEKRASAAHQH
jgi:hypothetical protein